MRSTHESASPDPNTSLLAVATRNWGVLVASTVICAAAAALLVGVQQSQYESTATLLVVQSEADGTPPNSSAVANVRTLLENHATAAAVIEKLGLNKSPESLTPGQLTRERLRVSQLRDTTYLQVGLRLSSAAEARRALAALIEGGMALHRRLETNGAALGTDELLGRQAEDAKHRLEAIDKAMLELRSDVQIERLQTETEAAMRRQQRVLDLDAQIAAEQTRLTQAEKELAMRVRREPSAADGEAPSSVSSRVRNSLDPVYDALDYDVASARMRVQALRAERNLVAQQSHSVPLAELHQARASLERLELEQRRALQRYDAAVAQVNDARKSSQATSVRILVVDPPSLPDAPIAPRTWLSAALAGALGLAGALFGLVAFAWRGAEHV